MCRPYVAVVLQLFAAGEAADDDVGGGVFADGGEEALFADGAGDVVVGFFVAEGAGHAAAAGVEFARGAVGDQIQQCVGGAGADEGLLVAVAVEEDFAVGGCWSV